VPAPCHPPHQNCTPPAAATHTSSRHLAGAGAGHAPQSHEHRHRRRQNDDDNFKLRRELVPPVDRHPDALTGACTQASLTLAYSTASRSWLGLARAVQTVLTAAVTSLIERAGATIDVDDCGKVNVGGTQGKSEKNGQDGNVHARTECQTARECPVVGGRLLHFAFEF
jgi:hypothetical protein